MRHIKLILALISLFFIAGNVFAADLQVFINYEVGIDARDFIQGEPVIINLTASNPDAMNLYYQNLAYDKNDQIAAVKIGDDKNPWINYVDFTVRDSNGEKIMVKFYANYAKENIVNLGPQNSASHKYFISPQDSETLKPGDYTITAVLRGQASQPLKLSIAEKKELSKEAKLRQLYKLGKYYLLLGKFEEALKFANELLAISPADLLGLELLGDAQSGLGRYEEAYYTFDKAIDEYFIQHPPDGTGRYEAPEIFAEKRNEVKYKFKK